MADRVGIVIAVEEKNYATVLVDRKGACGGCRSDTCGCRSCLSNAKMESRVANPVGTSAGDLVNVQLAWGYAVKRRRGKTWKCEYVDFRRSADIRLRPGAPLRPRGFYLARFQPGGKYKTKTDSHVLKQLDDETGCGPEGMQFLAITHPHAADLMSQRKIAFMAMADYDVAPHGFNDFYDAVQLFRSNGILGLGIGNVDRNYPLFGIPTLRM